MKFLLNMNLPRWLSAQLVAQGHQCRHVSEVGMAQACDAVIMSEAKVSGEILLTHDLDYGQLLAFSGEKSPSVVIFRLRNSHPRNLFARITNAWPEIERPLLDGAIVVLEDAAVRIRRLPIGREASDG